MENEYHPLVNVQPCTALRNLYIEKCFRFPLTGESSNVNRRLDFLPDVVQSDSGVYFRSVTTWDYLIVGICVSQVNKPAPYHRISTASRAWFVPSIQTSKGICIENPHPVS